jgi:hypothetical protein
MLVLALAAWVGWVSGEVGLADVELAVMLVLVLVAWLRWVSGEVVLAVAELEVLGTVMWVWV